MIFTVLFAHLLYQIDFFVQLPAVESLSQKDTYEIAKELELKNETTETNSDQIVTVWHEYTIPYIVQFNRRSFACICANKANLKPQILKPPEPLTFDSKNI